MSFGNKGISLILSIVLLIGSIHIPVFATELETNATTSSETGNITSSEEDLIKFVEGVLNNGDVIISNEDMPKEILNNLQETDDCSLSVVDESGQIITDSCDTPKHNEESGDNELSHKTTNNAEAEITQKTTEATLEEIVDRDNLITETEATPILETQDDSSIKNTEISEPLPPKNNVENLDDSQSTTAVIEETSDEADVELMFWWPWNYKKYECASDNVAARKSYSSKADILKRYSKGTILTIVDSKTNSAKNLWYKTDKGYWIYSGNLRKHSCSATTPATKRWYERKNNDKHVYKTERAAIVCRCGETIEKKKTTSDTQNHDWNDVGKCNKCGHKYEYSLSTWWVKGEYMAKKNITLKNEPYSASGSSGSLNQFDIVNIVGYAKNAFGNKWYKTSGGKWIYESNIEQHSHSSYTDTGYCSCGKAIGYSTVSVISCLKELTSAYSSRKIPFPKAATKSSLSSGQVVTVIASNNWWNPSWYKTSNGEWIEATKLKNHSHNYSGGICQNAGCGAEFKLDEKRLNNGKSVQYETTGANKVLRVAPYSNRQVVQTLSKSGTVISLTHKAQNSAGHWWYKTSEGRWIYKDNIREHTHKTISGKCTSYGCNYDFGVRPSTFSPTAYIVTNDNSPYYVLPYSDSAKVGTYKKDTTITLNAEFTNLPGNLWYRTNSGRWIYSKNVAKHSHTYSKGECTGCGEAQPISVKTIVPTTFVTKENKISVWLRPYSNSVKKKTISTKGTAVTIVGSTINDANNLWYKTSEGYWIYSGNLEKASTATILNSNILSRSKYIIKVVDEYRNAISGATVTYGAQSATTSSAGYAELIYSEGTVNLSVSASNYGRYSELYTMNKFRSDTITLIKSGTYSLTRANLSYNGTVTDVRLTEKTLNQASNGLKFNLSLGSNVSNIKEYRLVQDGKTIVSSTSGTFENLTADSFKKNKTVYALVVDMNGSVKVNSKLLLNIIYSAGDLPTNISLGNDVKLSLPQSLPFPFGGMSAKVSLPVCPLNVDINDDMLRVGINFKVFDQSDTAMTKENAWQYIKRLNKGKFKDLYKKSAILKTGSSGPMKRSSPFNLEVMVGGYAEGNVKDMTLKGKIFVAVEVGASIEKQIPVAPIPLVAEISFDGKVEADGSITVTKAGISGNLGLSIEIGVGAYIGTGIAGLASIGVYGKGEATMKTQIIPQTYIDSIAVTANFGVKAKILGKTAWNVTIIQLGDYYLYRRGASLSEYADFDYSNMSEWLYDENNYKNLDRSYLDNRSGWYETNVSLLEDAEESVVLSQFDFTTMQSSTYTDIRPQVVTTSHTIMMVYVDDNAERSEENRTMLVYSLFNKDTEKWSKPQAVYDDETADFNFSVSSTGDEIYLVWQNANESLTSDMSLKDISKKTDLVIAKFDEAMGSFQNIETVTTDNEKYEMMPRVASVNNNTIVAWFENGDDDVYGKDGTNTVKFALKGDNDYAPATNYSIDESGILPEGTELEEPVEELVASDIPEAVVPETWITQTVDGEQPSITSLAVGYMTDSGYIAFTIDSDGDTATVDDQEIKLVDVHNPAIVSYTDQAMNVEFTKVHGDNAMTWFNQGYIYYGLDSESAPQMLYTEATIPTDEYHIISSEAGNMAVLYTIKDDNKSDAYMILYDDNTYEWGLPVQITKQDKYIQNFNGAYYDEMVVSIFNQTEVTGDDLFEKNDLCCALVGERNDLLIEDVIFDDMDLEPNTEYPMTIKVKNNGTVRMNNVLVSIYAGNELIEEKTVPTAIRPGETINVETKIKTPAEIQTTGYVLFVEQENGNDADISNNRYEMTVGKALLKINAEQAIINDKNVVNVNVINTGYQPSGGSIVLYDEAHNIEKVLYENIDEISHNESFSCTVEFTEKDFNGEMYKSFCIGVIPNEEQYLTDYNTTSIMVKSAVLSEEAQMDVDTVVVNEDASEISLMGEFKKTISGTAKNETENDIENAKICVVAYDGRGIYVDTQIVETSLGAGESTGFTVEFDSDVEISSIKVMLLDDTNMTILSDYVEIAFEEMNIDAELVDEEELYNEILEEVEEY